jgi:hypothetical protein
MKKFVEDARNEYGDVTNAEGKVKIYFGHPIEIDTVFNDDAIRFVNNFNLYCNVV